MDSNSPLKIVVIQGPERKMMAERRGFHANTLGQFAALSNAFTTQQEDGIQLKERSYHGGLEERRLFRKRREYSCPSIIDFNNMKPYQELRPVHKPRRIFNGFFPSKVRSPPTTHVANNSARTTERQDKTLEELVPDPNVSPYQNGTYMGRVVLSRNSHRSEPSLSSQRSEPSTRTSERQEPKTASNRKGVYSLRNGSPSPWIDRYKLKQKSITASQTTDLKTKTVLVEAHVRGFSR